MIQSAFARNDSMPVDEFWKTVDPSEVMDSKLKVCTPFNSVNSFLV